MAIKYDLNTMESSRRLMQLEDILYKAAEILKELPESIANGFCINPDRLISAANQVEFVISELWKTEHKKQIEDKKEHYNNEELFFLNVQLSTLRPGIKSVELDSNDLVLIDKNGSKLLIESFEKGSAIRSVLGQMEAIMRNVHVEGGSSCG